MPLSPPSIIVVIVVVLLALSGGIVVGGGTQVSPGAVPGSRKCSVKKGKEQGEAKWGGGRYERVQRDKVRERGGSCGADILGGIRSKNMSAWDFRVI
jgi:hypothetical protein